MGIPVIYRKNADPAIASYDYIDAAAGLGYEEYFCYNQTATTKTLNKDAVASEIPSVFFTVGGGAGTKLAVENSSNWDLSFNLPRIIAPAPLLVSSVVEMTATGGASTVRMDAVVSKVDAANNVTLIASVSGAALQFNSGKSASRRLLTSVNMPLTKIKAGEKLRVNTVLNLQTSGSNITFRLWTDSSGLGTTVYNQVDPDDTTSDLGFKNTTSLKTLIPFKLEL